MTFILLALAFSAAHAQIFYKISGNGLEEPSYLFGSHHLAPLSTIDAVGARQALEEAEAVIGEVDMTAGQMAIAMKMQPYMMAPADSTLSKVFGPEKMASLSDKFAEYTKMPLATFDSFKPMTATSLLMVTVVGEQLNFDPSQQLDSYFQTHASEAGIPVIGLESVEDQAKVLYCAASIAQQAADLEEALENPEELLAEAKELNAAYAAQDIEAFAALSEKGASENPEQWHRLLDERNNRWMEKLPALLADKPSFVVVGALHLVGKTGLVESLRRTGYTVEPINN